MSDYDMFSCDWDEGPSVFTERVVQSARKRYRCDDCDGAINVGDRYQYVWGIWDDHASTFRHCQHCLDGPIEFVERNCGCRTYGGEWMEDHLLNVFHDYEFKHVGVKFRVGRFILGMRQRGVAYRKAAA